MKRRVPRAVGFAAVRGHTRTHTCLCTPVCYFQHGSEEHLSNTCPAIKPESAQSSQWNLRTAEQSGAKRPEQNGVGMGVGGRWGQRVRGLRRGM